MLDNISDPVFAARFWEARRQRKTYTAHRQRIASGAAGAGCRRLWRGPVPARTAGPLAGLQMGVLSSDGGSSDWGNLQGVEGNPAHRETLNDSKCFCFFSFPYFEICPYFLKGALVIDTVYTRFESLLSNPFPALYCDACDCWAYTTPLGIWGLLEQYLHAFLGVLAVFGACCVSSLEFARIRQLSCHRRTPLAVELWKAAGVRKISCLSCMMARGG